MISGAFGLFRREPMIAAGGYLHETVGEDMEVVVRMRRIGRRAATGERVGFVPDPVAWTERLRDRVWLLLVSLVEGLGYRQLTAVWRLKGLIGFLRGRGEWGVMTRSGFAGDERASA